eukprot:SAG11_NODE_27554_length_331_cov_0.896552_2_plen_47_part_01
MGLSFRAAVQWGSLFVVQLVRQESEKTALLKELAALQEEKFALMEEK